MSNSSLSPVVKAEMLIRKPAAEVFEAFVEPEVTTRFWFTKSSGRLEMGKRIRWDWEMYGVGDELEVKRFEPNQRILIEWSDGSTTEWIFEARADETTFVTILNSGFVGSEEELLNQVMDATGGYTMVLCALKALLEHNVQLNVVADRAPDAIV